MVFAYDRDTLLTAAGDMKLTRDAASGFVTAANLGKIEDQRQFDERGLMTNYTATFGGTPVWSMAISYDPVNRITNKVESLGSVMRTSGYVYDLMGRLSEVWQDGVLTTTYTYDANGNRLTRNSESASYDAQDRILSHAGTTFTWSRNGDLRTRTNGGQVTTYTYDVLGALASVQLPDGRQVDYILDAAGRRIGKRIDGVLQRGWLWSGNSPVAELDGSSSLAMHFVYAEGIAPAFLVKGTETYRILSDERGSVRLVINIADGTVAQELDYDEFGRVLTDTAPGFQPFGFAGGLYDPDTGLTRFGLRDFDAFTGRWTSRDPLGFDGGSFSLYVYVNNDPVNFVDPIGAGPWTGTAYAGFKAAVNFGANAFSFISTAAGYSAAAAKGGVVVSGFAIYQFLNSGYGMVGSGINGLAAWHGARVDNPFPETIPGLITFVASRGYPSKRLRTSPTELISS